MASFVEGKHHLFFFSQAGLIETPLILLPPPLPRLKSLRVLEILMFIPKIGSDAVRRDSAVHVAARVRGRRAEAGASARLLIGGRRCSHAEEDADCF